MQPIINQSSLIPTHEHLSWLTIPDVAKELGLSRETVTYYILTGRLSASRFRLQSVGRPEWRISPEAFTAFKSTYKPRKKLSRSVPNV